MQDNYSDENIIQYIDDEMTVDEKQAFEKLLQEDAVLYGRYQFMLAAKQAIRSKGLKEQVGKIHQEYMQSLNRPAVATTHIPRKHSIFKAFMRVAAVLILAVSGYGVFEFGTTNNNSLYESSFIDYQIEVVRGAEQSQQIDSLYNAKNYNAVITAFNAKTQKDQRDYFIAAQSYLHLDKPEEAISAFQQIEKLNAATDSKYFVDETDFYLALAYIKAGRISEAEKQLNTITSNKQHLFYSNAKNISRVKLEILQIKN
ncbi:MAG TPA: hypothetical protein VFW07_06850 [Parafilimonas sp.]|nr:hypothetical protein [Parafilimonas sp.]